MKKLLLCICLMYSFNADAQKLKRNEQDKFTKAFVKETTRERIWRNPMFGGLWEVNIISHDGRLTLWLGMHEMSIFSISEGSDLYLLLENDKSIKLKCINGDIAEHGGKVWHGSAAYLISESDIKDLLESDVKSIRIDRTGGYTVKEISPRNKDVIKKCIQLVLN